ncbi:MAG: hypothetical protein KAT17_09795 [Candidatus Aminicenantes bacterium]|nr:hypothetical protein [Candidatus Aminicenantes bacterium]
MEQLEVISWKILDAIKESATKIVEIIGDLDTFEHMSVFCQVDEDFIELYYSELDSNYIRHFEDEEEFSKSLAIRKNEFGEENSDSMDYYDDDNFGDENTDENYNGYNIKDEEDEF